MSPDLVFSTALVTTLFALGTVVSGRLWLAHDRAKVERRVARAIRAERRHDPNTDRPGPECGPPRQEEAEAVHVLQRVKELIPDLDLRMMDREMHR